MDVTVWFLGTMTYLLSRLLHPHSQVRASTVLPSFDFNVIPVHASDGDAAARAAAQQRARVPVFMFFMISNVWIRPYICES